MLTTFNYTHTFPYFTFIIGYIHHRYSIHAFTGLDKSHHRFMVTQLTSQRSSPTSLISVTDACVCFNMAEQKNVRSSLNTNRRQLNVGGLVKALELQEIALSLQLHFKRIEHARKQLISYYS